MKLNGKVGKTEQEKVNMLCEQYFSISTDANYSKTFLARKTRDQCGFAKLHLNRNMSGHSSKFSSLIPRIVD